MVTNLLRHGLWLMAWLCCQTAWADTRILAWVPVEQAQTATVARALLHIRLAEAKREAEARLCNGHWVLAGETNDMQPPRRSTAPEPLGRFPAWHFVIRWQPRTGGCGLDVSSSDYQRALARHLPDWMILQQPARLAVADLASH